MIKELTCNFISLWCDLEKPAAGDPKHAGGAINRSQKEPSNNIIPDGLPGPSCS